MYAHCFSSCRIIIAAASIAAWVWLIVRIWKRSIVGAVLTFFFFIPSFYFLVTGWGNEEHDIRAPFFANIAVFIMCILLAIALPSYQAYVLAAKAAMQQQDGAMRGNPEMDRWCREKNDAVYNVVLGTCVEAEPKKQSQHKKDNNLPAPPQT